MMWLRRLVGGEFGFAGVVGAAFVAFLLVAPDMAQGAQTQPAATPRLPRVGVVVDASLKDVAAASLFESAMLQEAGIVPVERSALDKVISEQELTELFSPGGVQKRQGLGNLVHADVLVMVRRGEVVVGQRGDQILVPGQRSAGVANDWMEIVVFETKHGLRLEAASQAIGKDPQADCNALVKDVRAGLERYRIGAEASNGGQRIFAVLPFSNRNLGHELDSLEALFPSMLEEQLLKDPHVLVVALPEARALAEEAALANGDQPERRLPIFITGAFDTTGMGKSARLNVKLELRQNGRKLGAFGKQGFTVDQLPAVFADAANQFRASAAAAPPAAPTTQPGNIIEAGELAQQAEGFAREGDWAQVVKIGEAALLLDPSLVRMHGLVYAGMCHIAFYAYGKYGLEDPAPGQVEAALQFFTDSLPHLEMYLEHTTVDKSYEHDSDARLMLYWRVVRMVLADSPSPPQPWIDADNAAKATLWRVLQYKSDHKIEDCSVRGLREISRAGEFAGRADHAERRPRPHHQRELRSSRGACSRNFRIGTIPKSCARACYFRRGLCRRRPGRKSGSKLRRSAIRPSSPRKISSSQEGIAIAKKLQAELAEQAHQDAAPPPVIANPDITFSPLTFTQNDHGNTIPVDDLIGCLGRPGDGSSLDSVGDLRDVAGAAGRVAPHHRTDRSAAGHAPEPIRKTRLAKCSRAAAHFDGRLAWFIVQLDDSSTKLVNGQYYLITKPVGWALDAIDTKTHHVYVLTSLVGLPPEPSAMAPLGPGKVCVSGWFRRTWAAVASVDVDGPGNASR